MKKRSYERLKLTTTQATSLLLPSVITALPLYEPGGLIPGIALPGTTSLAVKLPGWTGQLRESQMLEVWLYTGMLLKLIPNDTLPLVKALEMDPVITTEQSV